MERVVVCGGRPEVGCGGAASRAGPCRVRVRFRLRSAAPRGATGAGRLHSLLGPESLDGLKTMGRDYENRNLPDDGPPDRRGSCRYPVVDVPAVLAWWETSEDREEHSTSSGGAEKAPGAVQRTKPFDAETYSA